MKHKNALLSILVGLAVTYSPLSSEAAVLFTGKLEPYQRIFCDIGEAAYSFDPGRHRFEVPDRAGNSQPVDVRIHTLSHSGGTSATGETIAGGGFTPMVEIQHIDSGSGPIVRYGQDPALQGGRKMQLALVSRGHIAGAH
jgi:hypothetical protein